MIIVGALRDPSWLYYFFLDPFTHVFEKSLSKTRNNKKGYSLFQIFWGHQKSCFLFHKVKVSTWFVPYKVVGFFVQRLLDHLLKK
ncbi:hypothetical protein TC_0265 [Chlamydia muridarum str. Nigg]|uniref:Uncharacterized protein n=1 Tax=Chlamydia muridarum (strain MoPn / Nigg) TaxID=243161 RepID=Q9PL43_CHLMU|nr:hypothetical protein TC_0265 [Chlamydia muridarum str. Nigg]